jgi:hypothetical protein
MLGTSIKASYREQIHGHETYECKTSPSTHPYISRPPPLESYGIPSNRLVPDSISTGNPSFSKMHMEKTFGKKREPLHATVPGWPVGRDRRELFDKGLGDKLQLLACDDAASSALKSPLAGVDA